MTSYRIAASIIGLFVGNLNQMHRALAIRILKYHGRRLKVQTVALVALVYQMHRENVAARSSAAEMTMLEANRVWVREKGADKLDSALT